MIGERTNTSIIKYTNQPYSPPPSRVMTADQFDKLFRTKKIGNLWYCYGTWAGTDFSHEAKNENDSKIEMWQILARLGFVELSAQYQSPTRYQLSSTSIVQRGNNINTKI